MMSPPRIDCRPTMTQPPSPREFAAAFPWRGCAFTTLTGLDDATSIDALLDMATANAGRVEWGVLWGNGQGHRYPPRDFIEHLAQLRQVHPDLKLALHLCGAVARQWIADDADVVSLASRFDRIQVNVNGRDSRVDQAALRQALVEGRHHAVITQHNAANEELTQFLGAAPNHALLFDASGGRGQAPAQWPLPVDGKVCGYAGGLGPDNVVAQLQQIAPLANGPFWIDMEASLRDDRDRFDLGACDRVLASVAAWRKTLTQEVDRFLVSASDLPTP